VQIATYDFGGDGPPLLLSHATGFHAHVWLPVVEALRDRFHCYGYDQRAHGDSDRPGDDDFSWTHLGGDVLRVLDALGLDSPFAAGHSSGAAALFLAEERAPGTFRALWGYEPIVVPLDDPLPPSDNPLSEGARRRREVFDSRDAAYENFASKPPFSSLDPGALRAYVEYGFADQPDGTVRLKCRGADEAQFYVMQASHTAYRDLAAITCPVTIVRGERPSPPGGFVDALAGRLPNATTQVLAGASHFGPLEQPAAVAASIAGACAAP
jgi:pimeloyl-ACP methyl ester carboxylesterase